MIASRRLLSLAVLSSVVVLQACGGGGGGGGGDTTPPTIVSTSIVDGATGVLRSASFTVTFSEPVAAGSVTASTVVWQTAGGAPAAVPYTVSISGSDVTLTPVTQPLTNFGQYTIQITTGVTDGAGNALPAAEARTIAFRTADDVAPTAPGTPSDAGAYATSTTVHFAWTGSTDDGSGVELYWLEVATATDGTGVVYSATQGTALAADVTLADGSTVYARVRALDLAGNGQWSSWSDGITVDATPPGAPGTPTSATVGWANGAVSYGWTAAAESGSGIQAYRIELRTDTTGTTGFQSAEIGADLAATFDAGALADGQTMYTRVQATDNAGNPSAWSGWSAAIVVDRAPPTTPGTPTDGGVAQGSTAVHFAWTGSTDAGSGLASYWLQVATATDGSGILFDATKGLALTHDMTVADGLVVYARVKAIDAVGNEQWSGWSDGLRVDTSAPSAPGTPTDAGAYSTTTTVHFAWTGATDSGSGLASYWLQVATATDGSGILFDATKGLLLSHDQVVADGQRVYARVRAIDAVGNEQWSGWSDGIQVDVSPPVVPGAVTDAGGWSSTSVALGWSAATDPAPGSGLVAGYTLQLATAPNAGAVVESLPAPGTSETYYATGAGSWPEGGWLYARVGAADLAGNTAWSVWSDGIQIDRTAPAAPGTPTDPGAFSTSETVHFDWTGSTDSGSGVASYFLELATATDGTGIFYSATQGMALAYDATVADGLTAYARVRAIDAVGNETWSGWSDGILVDVVPPSAPTGVASTLGGWVRDEVTFTWTSGTDAGSGWASDSISLVPASGDPADALATASVAGPPHTFDTSGLPDGTILYGLARSFDAAGLPSGWSVASPPVQVDRVGPVFASGPTDDGTWSNVLLTFDFGAATDAGSGRVGPYTVHLSTSPSVLDEFATVDVAAPPAVIDTTPFLLPDAFQVFARVTAVDALGNEGETAFTDGITIDRSAPEVPAAPTDDGVYSNVATNRAYWTPAYDMWSGTASYRLQAATENTGAGIFYDAGVGNVFEAGVGTAEGQTVYFRVQAIDAVGNVSDWSGWSDGILVDLTATPVAGAPTPDVARTNGPLVFDWTPPVDAISGIRDYELQLSATTAMDESGVFATVGAAAPPHGVNVASRPDGSEVYARVRAIDRAGNLSDWTAWSTAVAVDKSGPVFASAPTDDGAFSLPLVAFSWGLVSDPGGVAGTWLEVSTVQDPAGIVETYPSPASGAFRDLSAYVDGTAFYARLRAVDALGNESTSGWSDGIAIDRAPPSTPAAPSDPGVQQRELDVLFSWAPSIDDVSGVRDYTVRVRDQADAIVWTETSVTGTSFVFTGADGNTYRAEVEAFDLVDNGSGFGPPSDGITINSSAPGTPAAPADEGPWSTDTVLALTWSTPAGIITGYEVQIGAGAGPTIVAAAACDNVGTATSANCDVAPGALPNGTTYYARVRARDVIDFGGWSDWSDGILVDTTAPSAPGTPTDRGSFDDASVRFDWAPAVDAESGVALYQSEVYVDGFLLQTSTGSPAAVTFDASGYPGSVVAARARAQNGVGTWGDWSGFSDGLVVDLGRPWVTSRTPGQGWPNVGTNQDLVFQFSEPMDTASVQAALSVSCGVGCPKNGLVFFWSPDSTTVTVIPDAADPVGATNVDLLPEVASVHVVIGAGATDLAGNPIQADPQNDYTFTTGDETAPQLASLTVDGATSPLPPPAVQGGFTLVATFDEPMSPTRGGIRIDTPSGSVEARYADSPVGVQSVTANSPSAGQATYLLYGCADIRVGDVVTVQWTNPADFDVERATVAAVGSDGMGNCSFTVPNATSATWSGGGQVSYPYHWGDAAIAWTGPTTLAITLPASFSLLPGSDVRVTVSNASDAGGMWMWAERTLQVASLPGSDLVDPTILSAVPLPGTIDASRTAPVILRFSEPLDAASLAGAWAADADGNPYDMRYSSDEMGPVLLFMPRAAPAGGTLVQVHVPGTACDLAGRTLGADVDYAFDVAARTDFDMPVLHESLPPDGVAVDQIWQASAVFADDLTGLLEMLAADSVGNEDVRVTDADTGLIVRGFRASVEGGDGTLQIQSPPRSDGFSTRWGGQSIQTATATGGVATYTTWGPHGLQPGWEVQIQVQGVDNGCFNATAVLADVPSSTTFTLPTACADLSVGNGGYANWQTPRTLVVELALLPVDGGNGILDFEGNSLDPTGFTAHMTPPGTNRVPVVESLRDLRVGVATGPAGRQLTAYFRVRDPDNHDVTATITAQGALGAVSLSGTTQLLTNTSWGADYRFGNDGPPMGASPAEMDDANFPVSAYYPFEITLDDGNGGTTSFVRQVWVWAPADVPQVDAIDDGGTVRPVDAARPIVVENTATPGLRWSGVDTANADFAALQFLELIARNVSGNSGGPSALLLDKTLTTAPYPAPLEPSFYAWFASQMKFSPGGTNMDTQGWSLDFSTFLESTFVYGPANRSFAGREFGAARAHVVRAVSVPVSSAWDATGTYAVEGLPAGGSAPVEVAQALTRNDGAPLALSAYFGAAPDGGFMVTTTDPAMGLPLARRGFIGRNGAFFAVAGEGTEDASIEVGAYRDPALDFTAGVDGVTFSFVQLGVGYDATGVIGVEAMVGTAVAGPVTLAVSGTSNGGTPNPPIGAFDVPYTVDASGSMRLDVNGDGTRFVTGYLGGAPGALLGGLALDVDPAPDRTFLLLVAQQYAWGGAEDEALLSGAYPFVEHGVAISGGALADLYSVHGTLDFDGLGGFTFFAMTPGGPMMGAGTYAVDAGAGVVTLAPDAASGGETYLLRLGPDADTAIGISTTSFDQAKVLVMSR